MITEEEKREEEKLKEEARKTLRELSEFRKVVLEKAEISTVLTAEHKRRLAEMYRIPEILTKAMMELIDINHGLVPMIVYANIEIIEIITSGDAPKVMVVELSSVASEALNKIH